MENNISLEQKISKIIAIVLFFLYWIVIILSWITKIDVKVISIIIKIFMYLPFTLSLGLHKHRYGVLFVLIYSLYLTFINFISFVFELTNISEGFSISIIGSLCSFLFGFITLITTINLLRNKENKYKYILIILEFVTIIISIIQIIITNDSVNIVFSSLGSIVLLALIGNFYFFFPKIELKIFKDN